MLSHLLSCCAAAPSGRARPPAASADPPARGASTATASTATTTVLDLSRMDRQHLAVVPPRHVRPVLDGRPLDLRFPTGMRSVPKWVRSLRPAIVRLPDFQGRVVDASGCGLRRLEVGGEEVRLVRVDEGCRVDVPSARHALPVDVEWSDAKRRVVRRGGPDNHFNQAAPDRVDRALPRNCAVDFSTPGYRHQPISCRHIASRLDKDWSDAERSDDESPRPTAKLSSTHAGIESIAARHAGHARRQLSDAERFQAAIPHDHDARYFNLIAQSRDATVVANAAFPGWLSSRFAEMTVGEQRTYLLITKTHAMNLALRVSPGDRGRPVHAAIFIDPNAYSRPVTVETDDMASIERWSLERFVGPVGSSRYTTDSNGKPQANSLLVETPRGTARREFDARGAQARVFEQRLSAFPAADPADVDSSFSGLMMDHIHRESPAGPRSFAPGQLYERLCSTSVVPLRLSHGDAADISTAFETLRGQVARGQLSSLQALTTVAPLLSSYPVSNAVLEGRADALDRYRQGLEALLSDRTFTSAHSHLFTPLFEAKSLALVASLGRTGTPAQKAAAARYKELLTTVVASVAAVDESVGPPG